MTLIGLILFLILGMLVIGCIGNVIAEAAGLLFLTLRFLVTALSIAGLVWIFVFHAQPPAALH